jgi:3-phytase
LLGRDHSRRPGRAIVALAAGLLVLAAACSPDPAESESRAAGDAAPPTTTEVERTGLQRSSATTPATIGVGEARTIEEAAPVTTTTGGPLNPGAVRGTKGTLSSTTVTTVPGDPSAAPMTTRPNRPVTTVRRDAPQGAAPALAPASLGPGVMTASVALGPVEGEADDPAIWVDPADPARSLVIGTDKDRGLVVWDLSGEVVQVLDGWSPNNVDLRDGFPMGTKPVSLVVAADDGNGTLRVYRVDPATRRLVDVGHGKLQTGIDAHGLCLYHSPGGAFYAFANDQRGRVEQWALVATGTGKVTIKKVRAFDVGDSVEGCVADDASSALYIGEEDKGVWRYGAEGDAGDDRAAVDRVGGDGHLRGQVEGLTVVDTGGGQGFLIASSQGDDSFAVYRRTAPNAFVGRFSVKGPGGIGGCQNTDGIDSVNRPLGQAFPGGVFACHDGTSDDESGFKLVPLEQILRWAAG